MQLKEIHIDGFGKFSGKEISGLKDGLNVIFGQNEQGKTTLRTFIERVLFGFPTKASKKNPYPALAGGGYGGRLVCTLSDGRKAIIARKQGGKKSPATVTLDTKQLAGDGEITQLLGNITGSFYHNVYSFDLDEFAVLGALDSDELRQRVYGATEGRNAVSISSIKADLQGQAEDIYKKSGQNPAINKLLAKIGDTENNMAEMRKELSEYDSFTAQHQVLTEEIERLKEAQKEAKKNVRDLTNKQTKFKTYVDLASAQKELSELPEVPEISVESRDEVAALIAEIAGLEKDVTRETDEKKECELALGQLVYNQQLLDKEQAVIKMVEQSALYSKAVEDITPVSIKKDGLKTSVDIETAKLGNDWTIDRVSSFQLTHEQLDKIRQFSPRFTESNDSIRSARDKLAMRRQDLARGKQPVNAWSQAKIPLAILAAASATGIAAGLFFAQPGLAIFSGLLLAFCAVTAVVLRKGAVVSTPDPLEQYCLDELENAARDRELLDSDWHNLLMACSLDAILSHEGVNTVFAAIEKIQSCLADYEEYCQRLQNMESTIKTMEDAYHDVSKAVHASSLSGDVSADIRTLSRYLGEALATKDKAKSQLESIAAKKRAIEELDRKKSIAQEKLNARLSAFSCAGEEDFHRKYAVASGRLELNGKIHSLVRQIQEVSGIGELYDSFVKSLSQTDLSTIEAALEEETRHEETIGDEITAKSTTQGGLSNQLNRLASDDDISMELDRLEVLKQNLTDASRDWARLQLAVTFVEKAILKYEKTGQPEVLKGAAVFFTRFTGGAYTNIYRPSGEEGLRVVDSNSLPKEIEVLSTGTMQQLYLAIRFGLIQACERQSEPMPIIMDDLLVNFDDIRTLEAVKYIIDFAKGRQIIYLTCHGATRDALKMPGVNAVAL